MNDLSEFKINICIVTSWFPTKNSPSTAPFVYNFAKNLGKFGVRTSVIIPKTKDEESISVSEFMTIYRIARKIPIFSMLRLVNNIRPDVIHVHAPNFFSSNIITIAKLKNIPIIATVHRAEIDTVGNIIHFFRKHTLKQFNKIISVSDFTKSLALKAGVENNKISTIYNSCDESLFSPKDKLLARKKCVLPLDKKIILFVGNLIKIKGVYTLIESCKILHKHNPNFLVILIGKGTERTKLESLVASYKLQNNVKFVEWKQQTTLSDYYNAADIFVLPSMTEGHSVALLEAMASGLPLIASNIGGNKESVVDGINGFLFEVNNAKILAEKLTTLLNDDKVQESMAKNSIDVYFKKFSMRAQMENHLKLYRTLKKYVQP